MTRILIALGLVAAIAGAGAWGLASWRAHDAEREAVVVRRIADAVSAEQARFRAEVEASNAVVERERAAQARAASEASDAAQREIDALREAAARREASIPATADRECGLSADAVRRLR